MAEHRRFLSSVRIFPNHFHQPIIRALEVQHIIRALEVQPIIRALEVQPIIRALEVQPIIRALEVLAVKEHQSANLFTK